jgi:hypothetical protein
MEKIKWINLKWDEIIFGKIISLKNNLQRIASLVQNDMLDVEQELVTEWLNQFYEIKKQLDIIENEIRFLILSNN